MLGASRSRSESWGPVRTLAAAMLLMLMGTGYAIPKQGSGAAEAATSSAAEAGAAVLQAPAPATYFPAQFVNQGSEPGQHIAAF